jgi:hypothetical protein
MWARSRVSWNGPPLLMCVFTTPQRPALVLQFLSLALACFQLVSYMRASCCGILFAATLARLGAKAVSRIRTSTLEHTGLDVPGPRAQLVQVAPSL